MRHLFSPSGGFNQAHFGIGPGDLPGTYFQDTPAPATPPAQQPPPATPPAQQPLATPPTAPPAPEQNNEANMWRRKAEEAQKRLDALDETERKRKEAEMSDLDKEKSRADTAEKRAAEAEARALKLGIVNELGVPADAVDLLTASDEAGLRAQAEKIVKLSGQAASGQQPARQGGTVTNPAANQQPSIDEQIAAAFKAGNTQEAIRLKREQAFGK